MANRSDYEITFEDVAWEIEEDRKRNAGRRKKQTPKKKTEEQTDGSEIFKALGYPW